MALSTNIADITQVIQLAIAPVFLLSAVTTLIGVLTTFMARAVDRIRVLEGSRSDQAAMQVAGTEIAVLEHRIKLIFWGLTLGVVCALCVGSLIVLAFVDAFLAVNLSIAIASLFVAGMLAFIGSLVVLLCGVSMAVGKLTGFAARPQAGA